MLSDLHLELIELKRYLLVYWKAILLIFVSFSFIQLVKATRLPDEPPNYDSDWKFRTLNYKKLKIRINSTEMENISSYAFILWRIVNQNESFIWEDQFFNQTSVNVTQNLWKWRLLIWCPFNFTVSESFELGETSFNFVLPPLGSEPKSTNQTTLVFSQEVFFFFGTVVGGGLVVVSFFIFQILNKRKKS